MKYYETSFEDYIKKSKKNDYHPELNFLNDNFFEISKPNQQNQNPTSITENLIIYGPPSVGKYTQALRMIEKHSPSKLKHDKKIKIQTEKQTYVYRVSDIHFEIDMYFLGCNSKQLWHEIYLQIIDIVSVKTEKKGIILCKNFHNIHSELLDIFYSYIQKNANNKINLYFILLTEQISFIPNNIIDSCSIISISSDDKEKTNSFFNKEVKEYEDKKNVSIICDRIINEMNSSLLNIFNFRDILYDILIYNLDVGECIWYILSHFSLTIDEEVKEKRRKSKKNNKIKKEAMREIIKKTYIFLKYFNNNYRPIYHLESIFIYISSRL